MITEVYMISIRTWDVDVNKTSIRNDDNWMKLQLTGCVSVHAKNPRFHRALARTIVYRGNQANEKWLSDYQYLLTLYISLVFHIFIRDLNVNSSVLLHVLGLFRRFMTLRYTWLSQNYAANSSINARLTPFLSTTPSRLPKLFSNLF